MNVYEMVTDRIIAELKNGIIPWQKPWSGAGNGAFNRKSGKTYSLLNQLMLQHDGEYATFKQWQEIGGRVRKGEKAEIVVYWNLRKVETDEVDEDGNPKQRTVPILRYYNVFHISQVDGVEPLASGDCHEHEPIEAGEKLLHSYVDESGVNFEEALSDRAYYAPKTDSVVVPEKSQFENIEEFYSTAFHELVMVKTGDNHYIEISRYEGDASCTYLFEGVDTDSYGNEIDRYFLDESNYLDNHYYLFAV